MFHRAAVHLYFFAGLFLGLGWAVAQDAPKLIDAPTAAEHRSLNEPQKVSFPSPKIRLWLNQPQVICFQVDHPEAFRHHLSFEADSNVLRVLDSPELLENRSLGYMRVLALQPGQTSLRIEGVPLSIQITADDLGAVLKRAGTQIVTPADGSLVWGNFVVGVERDGTGHRTAPTLKLPSGQEIYGHAVPNQPAGPVQRFVYTVRAEDLNPGPNSISVVEKEDEMEDPAAPPAAPSRPLLVVRPFKDPEVVMETRFENELNSERPKAAGLVTPKAVNDDLSNRGQVVQGNPGVCIPIDVPEKTTYQMFVSARGDIGGEALPSIGLMLDERLDRALTQVRLATTDWQRVPLGHPFTLDLGHHILTVLLRNPFYGTQDDRRTLLLEQFQLAKIAPGDLADTSPAAPAMAGDPAMTMESSPAMVAMKPTSLSGKTYADASNFGVGFKDSFQDETITQRLRVVALTIWPDHEHNSPPPTLELKVNGQVVARETTPRARFGVAVDRFRAGKNTIQLVATLRDGQSTSSPIEEINLPQELAPAPNLQRPASLRYTSWDPAWDPAMLTRMVGNGEPGVVAFKSTGEAVLHLPSTLSGTYRIYAEAHTNQPANAPVLTLAEQILGRTQALSRTPISNGGIYDVLLTQAKFSPGDKALVVHYDSDPKFADRTLLLRSIRLEPVPEGAQPPAQPPAISILYPKPSLVVGPADAVVAQVLTRSSINNVDLIIDGKPQHLDINPSATVITGPVLLPLITRGLPPGEHHLAVVATDEANQTATSPEYPFSVAGPGVPSDPTFHRAIYLLNRMSYGPEPRQLARLLVEGPHEYLRKCLYSTSLSPEEENELHRLALQFPTANDVIGRATNYLLTESNPVRARFVMWTENHFSTWLAKDGAPEKSEEHDEFARLGPAPFLDLLLASASSPAMITYLDQRYSFANRLNENYAREVMELHTLGVKGGYNQTDVTTLADLLTGWTLSEEAPQDGSGQVEHLFRYDPGVNSDKPCEILGMEFPGWEPEHRYDRVHMALEMLTAHPSCSEFISRKLLEHYVSDPAPPELVNRIAAVYRERGGDMREMLLALIDQPQFWDAPERVASPFDYGIRAARIAKSEDQALVSGFLGHSGMGMFDRATPDGYPEQDGFFCSSNALLQRWKYAQDLSAPWIATGALPHYFVPQQGSAPDPSAVTWDEPTLQRAIDLLAYRATGALLSQTSNESALQLLKAHGDLPPTQRATLLATLISQLPEASLR